MGGGTYPIQKFILQIIFCIEDIFEGQSDFLKIRGVKDCLELFRKLIRFCWGQLPNWQARYRYLSQIPVYRYFPVYRLALTHLDKRLRWVSILHPPYVIIKASALAGVESCQITWTEMRLADPASTKVPLCPTSGRSRSPERATIRPSALLWVDHS